MAGQFALPSNSNLTVNALTTEFHNSTLSCGTGDDNFIAVFTIFAYGKYDLTTLVFPYLVKHTVYMLLISPLPLKQTTCSKPIYSWQP